ncbi:MAG: bifunctional heptose 7-phosphate kinase/heptose 1-phosphate adenyltransferase [Luteibaculaceae bacterium]
MNKNDIQHLFNQFNQLNVLVIGDVMIDAYLWGKVNRISPEAPVPVVSVTDREHRLGGAANVALNLLALGANPIICAVTGTDNAGERFFELLEAHKLSKAGMVKSADRKTTIKTRILGQNQQMLRVDEEDTFELNANEFEQVLAKIKQLLTASKIDAIIFEDYNKGLLTQALIKETITLAKEKNIPTAVDPKKDNFFAYKDVTLFKPNLKELREGLKIEIDPKNLASLNHGIAKLSEEINQEIALITLSEHGVYVNKGGSEKHIPAHRRKIADVSGAGDTVISVASLLLGLQVPFEDIAKIANLSGGLVCEELGVVPVNKERLLQETIALYA